MCVCVCSLLVLKHYNLLCTGFPLFMFVLFNYELVKQTVKCMKVVLKADMVLVSGKD